MYYEYLYLNELTGNLFIVNAFSGKGAELNKLSHISFIGGI